MVEERFQLPGAHLHGMSSIVKMEVLSDPTQVGLFRSDRVVLTAQGCFGTVEDIQCVHHLPPGMNEAGCIAVLFRLRYEKYIRNPRRISPPLRHITAFRSRFLSTHGGIFRLHDVFHGYIG